MARILAIASLTLGWIFLGISAFFVYLIVRYPNDANHGIPAPLLAGLPALFFGGVGWAAIHSARRTLTLGQKER